MAGQCGVGVWGPGDGAVQVSDGPGEVARIMRRGRVFFERVGVSAVHSVESAKNGVGHGLGFYRGCAEADGVPVENLVQQCGK